MRIAANQRAEIVIDIEPLLTERITGLKGDEEARARFKERTLTLIATKIIAG